MTDNGAEPVPLPMPTFKFDSISWDDGKRLFKLQAKVQQLEGVGLDEMDVFFEELDQLVVSFVEEVPREWLVPSAPDELDWDDPASMGWVHISRVMPLINAMINAGAPETVAKNLEAR